MTPANVDVVLAVLVVACVAVAAIIRGRLGRMLRALGDSPTALATQLAVTKPSITGVAFRSPAALLVEFTPSARRG